MIVPSISTGSGSFQVLAADGYSSNGLFVPISGAAPHFHLGIGSVMRPRPGRGMVLVFRPLRGDNPEPAYLIGRVLQQDQYDCP